MAEDVGAGPGALTYLLYGGAVIAGLVGLGVLASKLYDIQERKRIQRAVDILNRGDPLEIIGMLENSEYSDCITQGFQILGETKDPRALEYLEGLIANPEIIDTTPTFSAVCDQHGETKTTSSRAVFPNVKKHIGRLLESGESDSTSYGGHSGGGRRDDYKPSSPSLKGTDGRIHPNYRTNAYIRLCEAIDKLRADLSDEAKD